MRKWNLWLYRLYIEDAIPPIIDKETFYKVQELLKYNQRTAAHKNAKVDYILTDKLLLNLTQQKLSSLLPVIKEEFPMFIWVKGSPGHFYHLLSANRSGT